MFAQAIERSEETDESCRIIENGVPEDGQTILLVEDEKFVREVTSEVLQSAGYRVLTAKNSTEARGVYEEHGNDVDLLLSDMILPGETGLALACRLRKERPQLSVLLVSGYAMPTEFRELQPKELLAKPFSMETLLQRLRQLLKGEGVPRISDDSIACAYGAA